MEACEEMVNASEETSSDVVCIDSKCIMPEDVNDSVYKAECIGQEETHI